MDVFRAVILLTTGRGRHLAPAVPETPALSVTEASEILLHLSQCDESSVLPSDTERVVINKDDVDEKWVTEADEIAPMLGL